MNLEIVIVFALTAVMLVLFFLERLPIAITALLAIVVLAGTGILDVPEALSGFSSTATVTILAMFVLSKGVQQTGAVDRLTQKLSAWAGESHAKQTIALSAASGPISGFVNNTPVVAVLIPAAIHMARVTGISPSRLLMIVSNMAMLGGLLTIVGTSTSLLGNAVLPGLGVEPFGFFEFTLIGVLALLSGLVYYLVLGRFLLPNRGGDDLVERYDLRGFVAELRVPEQSASLGKTLDQAGLTFAHGVPVVRRVRDGQTMDAPPAHSSIRAGDDFVVIVSREQLTELAQELQLDLLPEVAHPLELGEDPAGLTTAEIVVTTGSRYIGRTIADIDFRRRYQAIVLAVQHHGRLELGPISKSRLSAGDVLLVQADAKAIERMREQPHLFVTREREQESFRTERTWHAVGIVAGVVAVAALGWAHIAIAALAGAILMVMTGCLKMGEFLSSIHWDVILLLAGIIPLGLAFTTSGAAAFVAQGVTALAGLLPPLWLLVAVFLITTLVTEVVSNNASVILLLPIVVLSAVEVGLNPRPFALCVILAASTSMLTPIGYQTNTMIYAPGNYRFGDYFRVGAPLTVVLTIVIPMAIAWRFPLV